MSRPSVPARIAEMERRIWVSLAGWLFRRPLPVPRGGAAFGYATAAAPLIRVFNALSAFEIRCLIC